MPEAGDTIKVEKSEAYGMFTYEDTTTTDEDLYTNYPAEYDQRKSTEIKQNDAYTLEESVMTDANENYTHPAEFNPSNTTEAKENEAYAVSIITEKNEAYKPLVDVNGACDEYDYI